MAAVSSSSRWLVAVIRASRATSTCSARGGVKVGVSCPVCSDGRAIARVSTRMRVREERDENKEKGTLESSNAQLKKMWCAECYAFDIIQVVSWQRLYSACAKKNKEVANSVSTKEAHVIGNSIG